MAQNLSPEAAKNKAVRDLKYAKTDRRRKMKAANQQRRRAKLESLTNSLGPPKAKAELRKLHYDHNDGRWELASKNLGNDGNGTKSEGKRNYKA